MEQLRVNDTRQQAEKRFVDTLQLLLNLMVLTGSVSPIGLGASLITHGYRAVAEMPSLIFCLHHLNTNTHQSSDLRKQLNSDLFESGANVAIHGLQIGLLIGALAICASTVAPPLLAALAAYGIFSVLLTIATEKIKEHVLRESFDVHYVDEPEPFSIATL